MNVRIPRSVTAAIFAFVLSSTPTLPYLHVEPSRPYSQADLESQALQSVRDGYALLVDPALDPTRLKLVGTVNEGDRATVGIAGRIAEIARFRAGNAFYGLRYTAAEVNLAGGKVEVNGDRLTLRADELTRLTFEVGARGPRPDDVTGQRIPHEFVFEYTNGAWILVFDRPLWPDSGGPRPDAPPAGQPILTHARLDDIDIGAGAKKVLAKPVSAYGTYNWAAAVDYAHWWANDGPRAGYGYNPAYISYPNDCTNFMSQALTAGGWTPIGGWYLDPNVWWYDGSNQTNSNTWSAADWLLPFINNSGRGYPLGSFTDLQLGDLMFADWAYNGTPGYPEHAMMLTYKTSNSYADIRFSYHSNDRYDWPLASILTTNPTPSNLYWGSRIQYTSN